METGLSQVIGEARTHWAKQRHAALPCPSRRADPLPAGSPSCSDVGRLVSWEAGLRWLQGQRASHLAPGEAGALLTGADCRGKLAGSFSVGIRLLLLRGQKRRRGFPARHSEPCASPSSLHLLWPVASALGVHGQPHSPAPQRPQQPGCFMPWDPPTPGPPPWEPSPSSHSRPQLEPAGIPPFSPSSHTQDPAVGKSPHSRGGGSQVGEERGTGPSVPGGKSASADV